MKSTASGFELVADQHPKVNKSYYVYKTGGTLYFQDNGGSGIRNSLSMELFVRTNQVHHLPDFPLTLVLTDSWNTREKVGNLRGQLGMPDLPVLSFSADDTLDQGILIPDAYFNRSPVSGLSGYDEHCQQLGKAGHYRWKFKRIHWQGKEGKFPINDQKIIPRKILIDLAKSADHVIEGSILDAESHRKNQNFLQLPDQHLNFDFKYFLDIESYGYLGETKFLMFCNRVSLLQDRPWHEWYYQYLKPYEHYIPVKRDLSDLIHQYQWLEQHPDQYEKICKNALIFAHEYLTQDKALERINYVICQLAKGSKLEGNSETNRKQGDLLPRSPYHGLPKSSFWKSSVATAPISELSGLYRPKFKIEKDTEIVTAGSCFAQHITGQFKRRGFKVLDAEPPPQWLPLQEAQQFGFSLYSARYGNIYTVRQLLQLYQESLGLFKPQDAIWTQGEKYFDALRPRVEPFGVNTPEFVQLQRTQHLQKVKQVFSRAQVFIFTLGQTECWEHIESGTVYPMAPGTFAGQYNPETVKFKNLNFNEIKTDFLQFRSLLRQNNPDIRFLLTLSPVHMVATAGGEHVLIASTHSKSVLRAVAGELTQSFADIDYFPSYEILTSPSAEGKYYQDNKRSITPEGVNLVMDCFFRSQVQLSQKESPNESNLVNETGVDVTQTDDPTGRDDVCDLELLEAFGP